MMFEIMCEEKGKVKGNTDKEQGNEGRKQGRERK